MANAIFTDVLAAIKAAILARDLVGISSANVLVLEVPAGDPARNTEVPYPCIQIAPWGAESLDPKGGTNERDDIGYPVLVAICAANNREQLAGFNKYLKWRESIRQRFHHSKIRATDGTVICYDVTVKPLPIVNLKDWFESNLFVSAMVLNCMSRETRG